MIITDQRKIAEVQESFQKKFPYLKLEFYRTGHKKEEGSKAKDQHEPEATIGKIRTKKEEGDLKIDPMMTVAKLESIFKDKYGLHVQVFRISGDLWLQTTSTDGWTLVEQNEHGRKSTEVRATSEEEFTDYREQP
jgi:hypothetical protein